MRLKQTGAAVVAAIFALGLTTAVSAQAPAPAKSADTMEKKADEAGAKTGKKAEKKPAKKSTKKQAKADKTMEKPAEEKK